MADERRCDRQPGLFFAANEFCTTDLTNGFCTPRQNANCQCWDKAQAAMRATGLSAQAVAWVYRHRIRIEQEAARFYGKSRDDISEEK